MRHPDLIGPDLLSEIVLIGSAAAILLTLMVVVLAALGIVPAPS
jgi:hypothetical protein